MDESGIVRDHGGALARFGLSGLPEGEALEEAAPYLMGLLPADEDVELPTVRTPTDRYADVLLYPDGERTLIAWLDVSAEIEQRQLLQQRGNELHLLAQTLEARNQFIRQTFGRYLSGEIVDEILESPEGLALEGETREVTILMNDLRGFTTHSEALEPAQVVRLLNHFLGTMTDIILRYQGTIDEFIGDAILVIFGAPIAREDDAARAVACATEMMRAMDDVNAWNREQGLPELEMGIGLNTGEVVVGNIGSSRRLKYGVVGSHVNLTGRIESYTVGGQILAADATVRAAGDVRIDGSMEISPKGVREPLTVHDVGGIGGPFDLFLEQSEHAATPLARPLACDVVRYVDKRAAGAPLSAELLALSDRGAVLRSAGAPAVGEKLRLYPDDAPVPGELFATVTARTAAADTVEIRFTGLTAKVTAHLLEIVAARAAD